MSAISSPPEALPTPPRKRVYTYEELVAEMPESPQPCELWDGELIMSPAPSFYDQEVALRLYECLSQWVRTHRLGKVIASPIDMVLSPHRVTQPDVAYIAKDRLHIIERVIMGPVDLAAEVISLGGRQRDRIDKKDLYEQYGVKEYWIIDPESQTVDVLFLEAGRYLLVRRWVRGETGASRLLPGFEAAIDPLFGDKIGQL